MTRYCSNCGKNELVYKNANEWECENCHHSVPAAHVERYYD